MNKSKEEIEFRILESKGKALLDREIMETFLSAVHERPQAQEIAKNLVNTYTGVGRILGREMDDLKVIEGVTDSAVAMIMCVKETLERVLREKLKSEPIMDLQGLVEYLNVSIGHSERECVKILYLNKRRQLIGEESYIGEMEKAPVYIKEIIKKALIKNATLIIMSHNHPGGSLEPSEEDQEVTKSLAAACSTVSVKLFDHIIALFTIIRTDRNMLLACYSHKHISYRIRTIIRKAISSQVEAISAFERTDCYSRKYLQIYSL